MLLFAKRVWPGNGSACGLVAAQQLGDNHESVNVHEDIKMGLPTRDQYIENYCVTVRNLAIGRETAQPAGL